MTGGGSPCSLRVTGNDGFSSFERQFGEGWLYFHFISFNFS
tara:strand:- start:773 stop:895 length:123 start_codon:yes stop_codon:yes gene_type:complete